MPKMTKEQFVEKCNKDITLMSNVCRISFDECAEMLFVTYKSFVVEDMSDEEMSRIIDKLNDVGR